MNLKSVRSVAIGIVLVSLIVRGVAHAQTSSDQAAVRNIPMKFASGWAKHDGQQLANIMSEDVEFVDVAGDMLRGKLDFGRYHTRLLSGRFKDSTLTPLVTTVRFLRPDLAVLHWSWKLEGDRNFDLTPRKPRFGLFTMIVEKTDGRWLVNTAQNTNRIPPPNPDPEMEGIKASIYFPPGQ